MIFQVRYINDSIQWEDLQLQAPELLLLNNCVEVTVGDRIYYVLVSFNKEIVESVSSAEELFSLKFDIS